jgi:CRISPR-associated protein Cas1
MLSVTTATVFPRIHAFANLFAAWHRIEHNDGGPGVDGVTLDDFELRVEENLRALERDLSGGVYQPAPLLAASMPKPNGGRRALAIPTVRDRVAQSGAALVVTPILDVELEAASFGFRPNRSVPHAVAQVRRYYDQGYRWVVDADIDDFFDEVDHEKLLARLRRSIPDAEFVALVRSWIAAPLQDGTRLVERRRGIPQGAPISPVLGNLFLDEFDEALAARGLKLVRFADDFLVLCKRRPAAEAALEVTERLLSRLSLALDRDKTRVTDFDHGFRFLGHVFVRSLVVSSANRLRKGHGVEAVSPVAQVAKPQAAPAVAAQLRSDAAHRQRRARTQGDSKSPRLRKVVSPQADTPMAQALAQALRAAGRDSLLLVEAAPLDEANRLEALDVAPAGVGSGSPLPVTPRLGTPTAPVATRSAVATTTTVASTATEAAGASEEVELPPAPAQRGVSPFRRTLYIQDQAAVLGRHDDRLVVRKAGEVLLEVPAVKVDQVFVFGRCALTTPAMTFCLQEEIPIVLLSSRGQYYGVIDAPTGDRVSLHRQQFARAGDPTFALATAKAIVRGKLRNSRVLLQRHQRRKALEPVKQAIGQIDEVLRRLDSATTLEQVHGHEGTGAARYFEAFGHLLQLDVGFTRRERRPPTDPVNSLLSFGYTLCFYNLYGLIRGRGLHPYVGHLHAMRDRHPALASDLLEEFRAPVVDSLVLYLLNSKLLTAHDFYRPNGTGACLLRDEPRKRFLTHFEQKLSSPVVHPWTKEPVDWRRAMDIQVAHMRQWISAEVTEYRPMEIR